MDIKEQTGLFFDILNKILLYEIIQLRRGGRRYLYLLTKCLYLLAKYMHRNSKVRFPHAIANLLVFKKIRSKLGLTYATKIFTGAAPIRKETLEFFLSLDMPILGLFGMTESTGNHYLYDMHHSNKKFSCT